MNNVCLRFAAFASLLPIALVAQQAAPPVAPKLSSEEIEKFLATARVVRTRSASKGITNSVQATLSDGVVTHDAHIQYVDEEKARFEGARGVEMNFRDTFRFNIAAYRLSKLLNLNMIPPSVQRLHAGREAAFTWWVDDVLMDEGDRMKKKVTAPDVDRWNRQMWVVRVFDQLIYNTDRNLGNLLITKNWNLWMIDHTRAFRRQKTLQNEKNLAQCEQNLLEAMKRLDEPVLTEAMGTCLRKAEIQGLLGRRDRIVAFFEQAGPSKIYSGVER